jgi:hypothetical protein
MKIEYRVKPVTRYIVTRHEDASTSPDVKSGAVTQIGNEYDTADVAYQVGYAVCKVEHERLGWPIDNMRIKYPQDPSAVSTQGIPEEFNAVPGEFIRVSGVIDKLSDGDRVVIADGGDGTYVPVQRIPGSGVAQGAKFDLRNLNQGQELVAGSLARS